MSSEVDDEITYTWSASGPMSDSATGAENAREFTMPATVGATITVTVVVDDKAVVDAATEEGSRKDGPQTLSLTLVSKEKDGPTDPTDCPTGMHKDANGDCVPDNPGPNDCPTGMHKDANGDCVPDNPGPNDCPAGMHKDANGNCVPDNPDDCPAGMHKDANGICVPDDPTRKMWKPGDAISVDGDITSDVTPQVAALGVPTLYVEEGQEVTVTMGSASDIDKWTLGEEAGTDPDTLTYKWKVTSMGESGTLSSPDSASTKWIVPRVMGELDGMTVTLECTVDDTPTAIDDDEGGTRNDKEAKKTLDFMVVRRKWAVTPLIGQHPQLDENGQFDPKNITWVNDGLIVLPDPEKPTVVLPSETVLCEVSEAHDWDSWKRGDLDNGVVEDKPLTYKWTADKGHFLVKDENGDEVESSSATGRTAKWVAPKADEFGTEKADVEIKCTIDDAEGKRVGAKEAGTRDDEALERIINVKVIPNYSYSLEWDEGQTPVAAGAKTTAAHQATFTLTVTDVGGNAVAGATAPKIEVLEGGHGPSDNITAKMPLASSTTDSNGKIRGTFTSGNRIETTTIGIRDIPGEDSEVLTAISIEQVWNQLDDAQSWRYDQHFDYDKNFPVTHIMSYDKSGTKTDIEDHTLSFKTVSAQVYAWDPSAGDDDDGDGVPDGDYVPQQYDESQSNDLVSPASNVTKGSLMEWSPETSHSDSGEYTSNLLVKWNDDFVVSEVYFDVVEHDVYDQE